MNAKQCAKIIKIGLRKAGIDFVATLPDEKVVELIKTVKRDSGITHIRLSREEEGVGICAGAYLTGKRCALIMQNGSHILRGRHRRPWLYDSGIGDRTRAKRVGHPHLCPEKD